MGRELGDCHDVSADANPMERRDGRLHRLEIRSPRMAVPLILGRGCTGNA